MFDSIRAVCPHCGAAYKLPASAVGKSATCKQCEVKFKVSPAPADIALPDPESPPTGRVLPRQSADPAPLQSPQSQIVYVEKLPATRRRDHRVERSEITHRAAGSFSTGFGTSFGCLTAILAFAALGVFLFCGGGLALLGLGTAGAQKATERAAQLQRENAAAQAAAAAAESQAAADKLAALTAPKPCTITPENPGSYWVPQPSGENPTDVILYEDSSAAFRDRLVKAGDVRMINAPTAGLLESTRDGWAYVRPTEGPHAGKLLAVREKFVTLK